jgi:hypothetical protein
VPLLDLLYEDNDLRITSAGDGSQVAIVVFTSIGGNFPATPNEEFLSFGRSARNVRSYFVTDKNRTWYNAQGLFERAIAVLLENGVMASSRRILLGNSMGGFGAILFSTTLGASVVLSFVPQFTLDQSRVPEHGRWGGLLNKIQNIRFIDLSASFNGATSYSIFHGTDPLDMRHVKLFPRYDNIHHYIIYGSRFGHGIAQHLKRHGILGTILNAGAFGKPTAVHDVLKRHFKTEMYGTGRVSTPLQRAFGIRGQIAYLVAKAKRKASRKL